MDLSPEKKYITAKEASALTGFVADYITRQCRAGKIASRQIGRVWLIEKESLLSHFASEAARKIENAKALARAREAEYAVARKAREEARPTPETSVESPFSPMLSHPSWFSEEIPTRTVRGSFAALALTLAILSAGLYAGLPQTQQVVVASVYRVGVVALGVAEEVVVAFRDRSEAPQERALSFDVSERVVSKTDRPSLLELPTIHELAAVLSVPEVSAPKLVAGKTWKGDLFTSLFNTLGGASSLFQEIPRSAMSFVHTIGFHVASTGNQAPHATVAFVRSLEGEALGVVGHIALAYDTAKDAVSGAYDYAPRTNLAAVSGATVASSSTDTSSVFENAALSTYRFVNSLFSTAGNSFASLFAPRKEETQYVEEDVSEAVAIVPVVVKEPVPSLVTKNPVQEVEQHYSSPIYNEYYTITSTGISKEYVGTEIRRHIENLDDRIDKRLDNIGGGGGGGGSGSVTSVDMSGGSTGLSFAGGPITSAGTFTLSGTLAIANGGTGITTAPTYGQLLMGNSLGGYTLVATSSLGLAGAGGTPGGSDGEVQFNQGGAFGAESAFSYASTTNTLSVVGGVIQSTSGIFRGDDEYHQIIFHNVGNRTDYIEWGDTLAAGGGHRFYTGGASPTLRAQIADDGTYFQGPFGIGTTSPFATLSVAGSGFFNAGLTAASVTATSSFTVGSSTNAFSLSPRTLVTAFPVPSFRPMTEDTVIAVDIMPNGSPSENPGNGYAWIDVCDTDILTTSGAAVNCARVGARSDKIEFGARALNGATAKPLVFTVGSGSEVMRFSTAGNVGIGTTTPNSILSIATSAPALNITDTRNGTWAIGDVMASIIFRSDDTSSALQGTPRASINMVAQSTTGTATGLSFLTNSAGTYTEAMRITNLKDIGIGTTSPSTKLHVYTTSSTDGIRVDGTTNPSLSLAQNNTVGMNFGVVTSPNSFTTGSLTGDPVFQLMNSSNFRMGKAGAVAYFSVLDNGNVGVGSTTPWAQLSINPNGITGPAFVVGSSTATNFVVTNDGKVGIGTSNPSVQLDIVGAGLFSGGLTVGGNVSGGGHFRTSASGAANNPMLGFVYGGGTGLFTDSGTYTSLGFSGGGVERMRIHTNGNLGIGTTSPYAKLSVHANNGDTNQTLFAIASSTASATTTFLSVLNTGNVGIGTTSPVARLEVASASAGIAKFSRTTDADAKISFNAGGLNKYFVGYDADNSGNFQIDDLNALPLLSISQTGNVGIGTSSPAFKLDVNGSSHFFGISSFDGATYFAQDFLVNGVHRGYLASGNAVLGGGSANDIVLDASTDNLILATADTARLTITNAGNVGVGTTTPDTKLSVVLGGSTHSLVSAADTIAVFRNSASTGSNARFNILSGANGESLIQLGDDVDDDIGGVAYNNSTNALSFRTNNTSNRLLIDSVGNVGVGTTTPSARLTVANMTGGVTTLISGRDTSTGAYEAFSLDSDHNGTGVLKLSIAGSNNIYLNPWSGASSYINAGNFGIGTTTPWRRLSVTDTSAQFVTGYDSTRYTQFSTDSVGDLTLDPQGGDIFALDENLYVCAGGACPSGTPGAAGTIVAETAIGIASSTPWAGLSLASGKALVVAENTLATSTSMTIDWRNGNQQLVRLGTSATTISFSGYVEGQKLTLMVCNPNATAGAVSWATQVLWSGGSAPTQTTTSNKCDVWSFLATQATSTMKIFGSQSANF